VKSQGVQKRALLLGLAASVWLGAACRVPGYTIGVRNRSSTPMEDAELTIGADRTRLGTIVVGSLKAVGRNSWGIPPQITIEWSQGDARRTRQVVLTEAQQKAELIILTVGDDSEVEVSTTG
jgi:hypothetical protein